MSNEFPSEFFLDLLDKIDADCSTSRIVSETEEDAYVELAFTVRHNDHTDTDLETDALHDFINRNGCHNAESFEDHDARLVTGYKMSKDPEEVRRALIYIKKNANKVKE